MVSAGRDGPALELGDRGLPLELHLEVDRQITQNIQLMAQYRGFLQFNGVSHNIDGMGRNASDNNTLWLSVFFAF